jgi:hypothetical protein
MTAYKRLKQLAAKMDSELMVTDFKSTVHIIHRDKSVLLFTCAKPIKVYEWLLVFTEHLGYFILNEDDLIYLHSSSDIDSISITDLKEILE